MLLSLRQFPAAILLISFISACLNPASGQDLEMAVLPLPAALRAEAAVLIPAGDGSFEMLKSGHNGFFCLADTPDDERLSLACHPLSMRDYLERRSVLAKAMGSEERDQLLAEEIHSGSLPLPHGAISRFISGALNAQSGNPDSVMVWSELAMPFVDAEETGIPTENAGEAPWLMRANQFGAHVMIDYRAVAWKSLQP